jgi:hypothetical protein
LLRKFGAPADYTGTVSRLDFNTFMYWLQQDTYYNNTIQRQNALEGVGLFFGARLAGKHRFHDSGGGKPVGSTGCCGVK